MYLQAELVLKTEFKQAFKDVKIFGVVGTNGSGKDTLMSLLSEHGYYVFNTGDNLRQLSKTILGTTQRGGNNSPTGLIANAQRKTYPGGMVSLGLIDYWSRILHMPSDLQAKGLAIGSIRSVNEATTLKEFGGTLISVDAKPEIRYKRVTNRARTYESQISYDQFIKEDEAEMGYKETNPAKFGTSQVMKMADIYLDNSEDDINNFKALAKQKIKLQ